MQREDFQTWVEQAPILEVALVLFAGMALCAAIGWFFRRRRDRQLGDAAEKDDSHEGYMISAVLGLLALLTGFTFSLAIDRFDTRRERALTEANAIGTTYLRAQLLEEPHRARISNLLVEYVDNRLVLANAAPADVPPLLKTNDQLVTDLWTATVAAFPTMRGYDFSSAFLESMNEVIDMDTARKATRRARVPAEVFFVLFIYQFMSAGALGYVLPAGFRGKMSAILVFVLFGMALILILDIDRPNSGGIRESQFPMELLRESLRNQPPAVFDRLNALDAATIPPG